MKVPYQGTLLRLGPGKLIIPPLSLGQVRKLRPLLAEVEKTSREMIASGKNGTPADPDASNRLMFDCYVPIVHAALSRNYPTIDIEEVESMLDMGNYSQALAAAMGRTDGGVDEVGETQAVVPGPTGPTPSGTGSTAA